MKAFYFRRLNHLFLCIIALSFVYCSSDGDSGSSSTPPPPQPKINFSTSSISFGESYLLNYSTAQTVTVDGSNLDEGIDMTASGNFEVSLDNTNFSNNLQIPSSEANNATTVYVRFIPTVVGQQTGEILLESGNTQEDVILSGIGTRITHSYTTFNQQPLGFGGGFNQAASQTFTLHDDLSTIQQIKMYLKIDCPITGCDDWDRFANIKIKDPTTNNWLEIGRYITPYWVGTQLLDRGLEFDVTDFKSLLSGSVELRIYIENWTAKADIVTLTFDFIEETQGLPAYEIDYPYYAVSEVLNFHANSISGVPYGVSHSLDLDKSIALPSNTESAHLRTLISGWGHATPYDPGGRPCAEWCYRTHHIKINGTNTFQHYMGPIGCASNPINNQSPGNWTPDRAGWCPGMVVPVRTNALDSALSSFNFEYDFEDWTNDGANGDAYYATSTYVVVKSNTPISAAVVTD